MELKIAKADELVKLLEGTTSYEVIHMPNLSDTEYDDIKPVMNKLGGRWDESIKSFVFPSDTVISKVRQILKDGKIEISDELMSREQDAYFPTPYHVIDKMIVKANLSYRDNLLDSSAGDGRIWQRIYNSHTDKFPESIICIEPDNGRYNKLRTDLEKSLTNKPYRYETYNETFEATLSTDNIRDKLVRCNKIIINPPFKGFRDIKHLLLSYLICLDGGDIVCILQRNSLYYTYDIHKLLSSIINLLGDDIEIEELPVGTFIEESTTVDTIMVHIHKDLTKQNQLYAYKMLLDNSKDLQ